MYKYNYSGVYPYFQTVPEKKKTKFRPTCRSESKPRHSQPSLADERSRGKAHKGIVSSVHGVTKKKRKAESDYIQEI